MKRLLFSLLLLPVMAGAQLTIDTSKITKSDVISFLSTYQVVPTPKPEEPKPSNPVQTTGIEKFVNAYYTSSNAITDAAGVVTRLKAVKGSDLPYVGLLAPTIARPYLANGELVFTNQPNANFKLLTRQNNNPFALPEEVTIVFRKLPGTAWEAIMSGWGNPYIGFSGDNIRAGNAESYLKTPAFPALFQLSYIHVKYEVDGATVWLNGRHLGKIPTTNIYRRLGYGVGIETNSTDFNWLASMFIERSMSDQERAEYFKAIEATYKIGSMPTLPYASDIKVVSSGGRMTASYKYNGVAAEDKSKVQYQWWQLSPDLGTQKLISTAGSIPATRGVKVCVKVTDAKGQSWMYVSGTYN